MAITAEDAQSLLDRSMDASERIGPIAKMVTQGPADYIVALLLLAVEAAVLHPLLGVGTSDEKNVEHMQALVAKIYEPLFRARDEAAAEEEALAAAAE